MTRLLSAVGAALALAVAAACERAPPPPRNDTAVVVPPPPDSVAPPPPAVTAWDPAAGPAMVVAGEEPGQGVVVFPEFTDAATLDTARFDLDRVRNIRLDLFARGRPVGQAVVDTVQMRAPAPGCVAWPVARLRAPAGEPLPDWRVGFEASRARAIAVDSIEQLSRADSARLVADIARLASGLPGDTAAAFRGLPFVVRAVRRFEVAPGTQGLVTEVVRTLSQEANPRQERLFIIAERDATAAGASGAAPYTAVYTERVSGPEESIESHDVLAILSLGASERPTIVITREDGTGIAYSLIERTGQGRWRQRWSSAFAGC